jgi:hypothetical protein
VGYTARNDGIGVKEQGSITTLYKDELLEEEHRWLEESEGFGPASEEGSAVLLAPAWLQELHKQRAWWIEDVLAPLAEVVPAGREFYFSVYSYILQFVIEKTTICPVRCSTIQYRTVWTLYGMHPSRTGQRLSHA